MKLNVAVFFGGRSVEHEISIISAQQTIAAADKEKYNIIPIYIAKTGIFYSSPEMTSVESFKNIPALLKKSSRVIFVNDEKGAKLETYPKKRFGGISEYIDVALPIMHGTNGEDGILQGYIETLGLPYAGCGVLASALGMDKVMMKKILKDHGVPVLDCEWFYSSDWFKQKTEIIEKIEKIGYPVIVKPANLGSSVGIKKAKDRGELEEAVESALMFAEKVLVERAIENLREINCAVLGDSDEVITSVCEEPFGGEILSYEDKYMGGSKSSKSSGMASLARKVPAEITDEQSETIRKMVSDTFRALGCAGASRVDCMIDGADGTMYVNEINTIPGSLSFYLWEAAGVSFTEVVDRLISIALKTARIKEKLTFTFETDVLSLQGGSKGAKN